MPQVSSPALLQALGYTLINSLWQFAALWLLYSILLYLIRLSPRQKYVTGVLMQIAGFVWFIGTFYSHCAALSSQSPERLVVTNSTSSIASGWLLKGEELLPYF